MGSWPQSSFCEVFGNILREICIVFLYHPSWSHLAFQDSYMSVLRMASWDAGRGRTWDSSLPYVHSTRGQVRWTGDPSWKWGQKEVKKAVEKEED